MTTSVQGGVGTGCRARKAATNGSLSPVFTLLRARCTRCSWDNLDHRMHVFHSKSLIYKARVIFFVTFTNTEYRMQYRRHA